MKNIIVDFSDYNKICGFGEIARNYSSHLAAIRDSQLHFLFILPKEYHGIFGSHIDYISSHNIKKDILRYNQQIDLWHSIHQQFRYRHHKKGTIQLLTIHDLNYLYEKHGLHLLRHQLQMPWRIKRSDYITTISDFVKKEIIQNIPFLNKEPIVIYNGIKAIEKIPQQKPSFIKNENDKFFLCIGQVREKKNIHTVVRMMQFLPSFHLYICGDNHWTYTKKIQALILPEDKDRIVMTGMINDNEKSWLYSHAEALFFPSKHEGFGIPVLEAMRFGTKVFSSRFSCLPEVCKEHASYWDSFNPKEMARIVDCELSKWNRNSKLARDAFAYSSSFNYERYTYEYVQLYKRILNV